MQLLDGVIRTGVARIERLAPREPFILLVIIADAILAQFPAKVDFFVVDDRREIEQTEIQIFDDAAGLQYAVQRAFQIFRQLGVLMIFDASNELIPSVAAISFVAR